MLARSYILAIVSTYSTQNIDLFKYLPSEAVVQRGSVKEVFLEILQNSQENTCARFSFSYLGKVKKLIAGGAGGMRLSERFISMNICDNEKYISTTKYEIATKKQQDKFF